MSLSKPQRGDYLILKRKLSLSGASFPKNKRNNVVHADHCYVKCENEKVKRRCVCSRMPEE